MDSARLDFGDLREYSKKIHSFLSPSKRSHNFSVVAVTYDTNREFLTLIPCIVSLIYKVIFKSNDHTCWHYNVPENY